MHERRGQLEHAVTRLAMLSLHTSPLVQPGGGDAGGMNVYVRELVAALAHGGSEPKAPSDLGFMYQRTVADHDGNLFEPFWMDPAAV